MPLFSSGELIIETEKPSSDLVRLYWRGRSVARKPEEALAPFLSNLLSEAQRAGAGVEMHFETLEFFNSSTVSVLVQFLHNARRAGVHLSFIYLPSVRWQKLSFEALRVFEQLDQTVQVIPLSAA